MSADKKPIMVDVTIKPLKSVNELEPFPIVDFETITKNEDDHFYRLKALNAGDMPAVTIKPGQGFQPRIVMDWSTIHPGRIEAIEVLSFFAIFLGDNSNITVSMMPIKSSNNISQVSNIFNLMHGVDAPPQLQGGKYEGPVLYIDEKVGSVKDFHQFSVDLVLAGALNVKLKDSQPSHFLQFSHDPRMTVTWG